jgi:hypothetical protein
MEVVYNISGLADAVGFFRNIEFRILPYCGNISSVRLI